MNLREAAQQVLDRAKWINDEQAIVPYEQMMSLRIMLAAVAQTDPVAWMVYTLDGKSAFVTDNPAAFTPGHRALPLYTAPPKREPLTDEQIQECVGKVDDARLSGPITDFARAIERAHGIGGEK